MYNRKRNRKRNRKYNVPARLHNMVGTHLGIAEDASEWFGRERCSFAPCHRWPYRTWSRVERATLALSKVRTVQNAGVHCAELNPETVQNLSGLLFNQKAGGRRAFRLPR